jgi:predicted tellurium resistance membrane protein TerC
MIVPWLYDPGAWVALATLTVMEVVLGIDNVVFISVLVARLPDGAARRARAIGLTLAFLFRVAMLVLLSWIIGLVEPVFIVYDEAFSWRDLILIAGGLFLVWKATHELHRDIEEAGGEPPPPPPRAFGAVIVQIALIDFIFSIDSIVTAIGMAQHLSVMILAIILSMLLMFLASGAIARFIRAHPTTKALALAFLILIGTSLIADGCGFHVPRGYIYFAMAFAAAIEVYHVAVRRRRLKL